VAWDVCVAIATPQRPRPSRARQGPSTTAHYQWRYRTTTAPPTSPLPPLPAPVQRFVRRPTACPPGQRRPPDRRQPTPTQAGVDSPPPVGGGAASARQSAFRHLSILARLRKCVGTLYRRGVLRAP
jgi:hypothetical protein